MLLIEAQARERRKDASWWRDAADRATTDIDIRHWIFSLLTKATSNVVIELVDHLDAFLAPLSTKHFHALREAIYRFRRGAMGGELVLQEALRLHRIKPSTKTLWLLRGIATEASVTWIDKRLADHPDELLAPGIGDLRGLARISAEGKVIKFDKFKGLRSALPIGGWASDTRIGALSSTQAENVLKQPHQWPGDLVQRAVELVQRAVESVEERMLAGRESVASIARLENWFSE